MKSKYFFFILPITIKKKKILECSSLLYIYKWDTYFYIELKLSNQSWKIWYSIYQPIRLVKGLKMTFIHDFLLNVFIFCCKSCVCLMKFLAVMNSLKWPSSYTNSPSCGSWPIQHKFPLMNCKVAEFLIYYIIFLMPYQNTAGWSV